MIYEYILYNNIYYVPRMASLCAARQREEIFNEHFDADPFIVGPFEWEILATKMSVQHLEVPNV